MGLTFTEVYNLPVYIRRYYYNKLADYLKRQNEAEEKAYTNPTNNKPMARPPKVK